MRVLVLGSGGREHALLWKLKQSAGIEKLWCAPGNGGISREVECRDVELGDAEDTLRLAQELRPDLVVIGPELPLVVGAADALRGAGFAVVGPGRGAARLEGSKVFAKEFMLRHGVPTAEVLATATGAEAQEKLRQISAEAFVIKADGLCAGKGVLVANTRNEAEHFVEALAGTDAFRKSNGAILFEEVLQGEELSYIVLTDGERFVRMAPARDYKRLQDGDQGPNTGGMGAYSSDELLPIELEEKILNNIVGPTLAGLRRDGLEYRGFLYFGLMLTRSGPQVLEYNCRLGDPEAQAIMLRADFDLAKLLVSCAAGRLDASQVRWPSGASVALVLASGGYPAAAAQEAEISGADFLGGADRGGEDETYVFHSGTNLRDGKLTATGGRILAVCAYGRTLQDARQAAYYRASRISFFGMQFRTDIARSATVRFEGLRHAAD